MNELPIEWVRHVARQLGADFPAVRGALTAAGLNHALLADEATRVSARKFVDFLEHAARISGDDTLGLKLGRSYDIKGYRSLRLCLHFGHDAARGVHKWDPGWNSAS